MEDEEQGKEGEPAKGRRRLSTPVQVAIIGGVFAVLAAAVGGIITLATQNSPGVSIVTPSPGATSPSGIVQSGTVSRPPSSSQSGNLITLQSPGADAVAYSIDGDYLAAGNSNGSVRLWRTNTWQIASSMTDPDSKGVRSVAFSPSGSLATGDTNGHVYVWAGKHATVLTDPSGAAIRSIAFSFDSSYLAAGDSSGKIYVWQTGTWRLVSSMTDPDSHGVNSVAFNHNNSLLAAGDANGHVYLWAHSQPTVLKDPSDTAVESVLFTTDDVAVVGGDSGGNVYVWQVVTRVANEHLADQDSKGVKSVAFDSRTETIAAADGNGSIYLWLSKLPDTILQDPTSSGALSVAYSPDNSHLAVASASGNVYVRVMSS